MSIVVGVVTAVAPHAARASAPGATSNPGFLQVCGRTAGTIDNSGSCISAVVGAIDDARAAEGIGPIALPDDYASLPADAQLLTIVDRERADRGLAALAGITSELDGVAQAGADGTRDPSVTAPSYAKGTWQGTATEASAVSQALAADYFWMYDDGWDGSTDTTFNLECRSADDTGCWGHRRALLAPFGPGLNLSMGGAANVNAAHGYPTWTTVLMATSGRAAGFTYTWAQAQAATTGAAPCGVGGSPTGKVSRVAGADRDATAILASGSTFPSAGSAKAVVLASDANFPDALTGGPLAVAKGGPLLITSPSGVPGSVRAEIHRVLPPGATVYVLGGALAIAPSVDSSLRQDGYAVQRIAGSDRYETAVAIAEARGAPGTVIEVTGNGFADALAAAPAASAINAALLLTDGAQQATATSTYLTTHLGDHYAVGGPASAADSAATSIAGPDRYATALEVTKRFVSTATSFGFATGTTFPDALAGGAAAAQQGGGLLLVPSCGQLPAAVNAFLSSVHDAVANAWLFGGGNAVGDAVLGQVDGALD